MAEYLDNQGLAHFWAKVKAKLDKKAPAYTSGTADLTPGESDLAPGTLYFVYESADE